MRAWAKGVFVLCVVLAAILAIITMWFAFGFIIRIIAAIAAVIGTCFIVGAIIWLSFDELVLEPRRARKKAPK